MTQTAVKPRPRRPPPRIDETKVSQALQDLFAGWRVALKEPFKGISAAGEIAFGLFPLRKTGVSTQPLLDAVKAFLASLDAKQGAAVRFDVDSEIWRTWSNIHRNLMRHGLCMAELERQAARARLWRAVRRHRCARLRDRAQRHASQ